MAASAKLPAVARRKSLVSFTAQILWYSSVGIQRPECNLKPHPFWKGVYRVMKLHRAFSLAVAILAVSAPGVASAHQYVTTFQGREVVVHSNRIPVIMHRMVPPQLGRHITASELHSGKVRTPSQSPRAGR